MSHKEFCRIDKTSCHVFDKCSAEINSLKDNTSNKQFNIGGYTMTYKEFDAKYNKRHCGKLTHYSIIKETGEVVFQGSVNDADNYWDNNVDCLDAWKQGHEGAIDDEYVFYTCISEGLYEKYRQKGIIKFD